MKIIDFFKKYTENYAKLQPGAHASYLKQIDKESIRDIEISEEILNVLDAIKNGTELQESEIDNCINKMSALKEINKDAYEYTIGIFQIVLLESLNSYKEEIVAGRNKIDKEVEDKVEVKPSQASTSLAGHYALLNAQALINKHGDALISRKNFYMQDPNVAHQSMNLNYVMRSQFAFALNTLRLAGNLPSQGGYCGLDMSKPFYPRHKDRGNPSIGDDRTEFDLAEIKPKLEKTPGQKDADTYWPYRGVRETSNDTYMAVRNVENETRKQLFIRPDYTPAGVMASKIASIVSRNHFSSERMLDNRIVGISKLDSYQVPVDKIYTAPKIEAAAKAGKVFSGTGIVDEVCNFIGETDGNEENFALSSSEPEQAHMAKIDFDWSNPGGPYERNMIQKTGLYGYGARYQRDPDYIEEKLATRLKLVFLCSPELMVNLAEKAYGDSKAKTIMAKNYLMRGEQALKLFLEHPDSKKIYEKINKEELCKDIFNYIDKHYKNNPELQESLKVGAKNHIESVVNRINDFHKKQSKEELIQVEPKSGPIRVEHNSVAVTKSLKEQLIEIKSPKSVNENLLDDIYKKILDLNNKVGFFGGERRKADDREIKVPLGAAKMFDEYQKFQEVKKDVKKTQQEVATAAKEALSAIKEIAKMANDYKGVSSFSRHPDTAKLYKDITKSEIPEMDETFEINLSR